MMRRSVMFLLLALGGCGGGASDTPDAAPSPSDAPPGPADAGVDASPPTHPIDVVLAGAGSGTVVSDPAGIDCGATCSAEFPEGTLVALTALPAAGSDFAGWGGACAGLSTCFLGADQAWSVTATFDLQGYDLDVTIVGGAGSVTSSPPGIDCPGTCTATFADGTDVTLTPAPAAAFTGWTGACTGGGGCTVAMDGDKAVSAVFAADAPSVLFASQYGGALQDEVYGLALDPTGGFAIVGQFAGVTNFGGASLSSAGSSDVFLAHFTAAGAHDWSLRAGGGSGDSGSSVAVAPDGSVAIGGRFAGTADFGSGAVSASGMSDGFVARYAAGGSFLWSRAIGATGWDEVYAVTTLPGGDVIVGGRFEGTVDFGSGPVTHVANGDLFLLRLAGADGSVVWSRTVGAFGDDRAYGLAVHTSGDLVVSGQYSSGADFGGGAVTAGSTDAFLARYTPAGSLVWVQGWGHTSYTDIGYACAVGPSGQIAVAGAYVPVLAVPLPGFETTWGNDEVFVIVVDEAGLFQWGHSWGSINGDRATDVAFDAAGDLYLTGTYGEDGHFDGPSLLDHTGVLAAFVGRWSSGSYVWARGYPGASYVVANALEVDGAGNVLVSGYFYDTVDFDIGPMTSAGNSDAFVLGLGP
jgi:hypothetical protein